MSTKPGALPFFHALLAEFPFRDKTQIQKERLIGISLNTFAFRMYGVSDMLMFGAVEDLLSYWDGRIDTRRLPEHTKLSLRQFAKLRVVEVDLCASFLERTGWNLKWTLADSWYALSQRFIIADAHSLDLHWVKYPRVENRWKSYTGNPVFIEISFSLWLQIHQGLVPLDESVLDLSIEAN
jgi:hypothetical protein